MKLVIEPFSIRVCNLAISGGGPGGFPGGDTPAPGGGPATDIFNNFLPAGIITKKPIRAINTAATPPNKIPQPQVVVVYIEKFGTIRIARTTPVRPVRINAMVRILDCLGMRFRITVSLTGGSSLLKTGVKMIPI